ncbi:winged helix-turn-helix transcriptional regulator, partial [Streptomyces lunaelactis]|uniref:MarR family winged helix-turn-helix transcriptional regulator n=1 Tax=Streptomyces lunaelactis TaxID=1535768 RepID=UPI00158585C5
PAPVPPPPLPAAGSARDRALTRQAVQRTAYLLAERGLAASGPTPPPRRAKLLRPTDEGRAAIAKINPGHAELAARLAAIVGKDQFSETARILEQLSRALDGLRPAPDDSLRPAPEGTPHS